MDFTKLFLKFANTKPEFQESVKLIKENSEGGIWLIGGFVCRGIIQELYGIPATKYDFDFIIEKEIEIKLPTGWKVKTNSYGNPKLLGPNYEIDYIPLNKVHSIERRNLEPTIENFLSGTPLTIQSIVYDVVNKKVIGNIGMKAIRTKTIGINNLEQAKHRSKLKGKTVEQFVKDVAEMFNFTQNYLHTPTSP